MDVRSTTVVVALPIHFPPSLETIRQIRRQETFALKIYVALVCQENKLYGRHDEARRNGTYTVLVGCCRRRESLVRSRRLTLQLVVDGKADALMRHPTTNAPTHTAAKETPRKKWSVLIARESRLSPLGYLTLRYTFLKSSEICTARLQYSSNLEVRQTLRTLTDHCDGMHLL